VGRHRLDARAGAADRAVLVALARVLLRTVRLVPGAGAPDAVPASRRTRPPGRSAS
jgi:hypothetical protein